MFDPSVHGPLRVSARDRAWASDLLAEIAGNEDRDARGERTAPFSTLEQQVLQLGLMEDERPTPRGAHATRLARAVEWLAEAVLGRRGRNALANPRLEALRCFSAATRRRRGSIDDGELSRFLKAGFSLQQSLEIAIRAVAASTATTDRNAIRALRSNLGRGIMRANMLAGEI